MSAPMTESRFYMWRAVFAMAHVDHVVTAQEKSFLYKILADHPFTEEQRHILEVDMEHAQDTGKMFERITDQKDRSKFFQYARALVWCDGDFAEQEQKIMVALNKSHVSTIDYESITDTMGLELADEDKSAVRDVHHMIHKERSGFWRRLFGRGGHARS